MARQLRYKRVVLKLSGESLRSPGGFGIELQALQAIAKEVRQVAKMGVQVAVVIGGGNFIRGRDFKGVKSVEAVTADYMGMLATLINALALRDTLVSLGSDAKVFSAIADERICEPFNRRAVIEHLEGKGVAVLAGGTGSPFFTTDTCAALRANEVDAEVLLKATTVDGVYDSDPKMNPNARKYDQLTYEKVLADKLGVMDLTAISMCMESRLPIIVFALFKPGNLARAVRGQKVGTIIRA